MGLAGPASGASAAELRIALYHVPLRAASSQPPPGPARGASPASPAGGSAAHRAARLLGSPRGSGGGTGPEPELAGSSSLAPAAAAPASPSGSEPPPLPARLLGVVTVPLRPLPPSLLGPGEVRRGAAHLLYARWSYSP